MNKSFTLVELIVVIAIIAILAAIIAPNAFRAIEKAKISQMISDMKTIKQAFLALYADVGSFPLAEGSGYGYSDDGRSEPRIDETDLVQPVLYTPAQGWDGPYIEKVPQHPWGGVYRYDNDGDCYPQDGPYAGANVFWWMNETGVSNQKMQSITEKADIIIDGGDGARNGAFRYVPYDNVLYLIWPGPC